jgi:hypothetical protein
MPTPPYATARSSKPMNVNDQVTVIGFITAISGSGPTATITVSLAGSGTSVSVQAQDCAASSQTL